MDSSAAAESLTFNLYPGLAEGGVSVRNEKDDKAKKSEKERKLREMKRGGWKTFVHFRHRSSVLEGPPREIYKTRKLCQF